MKFISLVLSVVLLLCFTGGCVVLPKAPPEPSYAPTMPFVPPPVPAAEGAMYRPSQSINLFVDRKSRRVGDLVTIRFEESTKAAKDAETTIKKDSETITLEPLLLQSLIRGLSANKGISSSIDSKRDFTGESESLQSNSLTGTITAIVAAVYPNGVMLVRGEKRLNLNRGEEYIRVKGLVRPEDIDGTNTVSSLRLADARISYSGTGALADSNAQGWLSRFFLSPKYPF